MNAAMQSVVSWFEQEVDTVESAVPPIVTSELNNPTSPGEPAMLISRMIAPGSTSDTVKRMSLTKATPVVPTSVLPTCTTGTGLEASLNLAPAPEMTENASPMILLPGGMTSVSITT